MPGGWADAQTLPKGAEGRSLCRWCSLEVPKGRRTFCSDWCVEEWRLRSDPGYLRERVLRREQFHVESARDGFEAIEKISSNDYGTILLDLMMPRIDGLGVLRYLESERPAPKPAVIVMSANLQVAAEVAEAKPIFRVLPKPFDIRELISHVKECASVQSKPCEMPA